MADPALPDAVLPVRVAFFCEGVDAPLDPRAYHGTEELGEPTRFDIEVSASQALDDPRALVAAPCALAIESRFGTRLVRGVVRSVTCLASGVVDGARSYRFTITSALGQLDLRRDSRIFQKLTGPDIATLLLDEVGAPDAGRELAETYPPIRYRTQYDEPSLRFLRRICEQEGFWYRFEAGEDRDEVILCDDVAGAPDAPLDGPLVVDAAEGLDAAIPRAFRVEVNRRRRPGRVSVAGYNFRKPALGVTGEAKGGEPADEVTRLFCIAPDASAPDEAKRFATIALQAARADTERVSLQTSAVVIRPGHRFEVEIPGEQAGPRPERSLYCVKMEHRWRAGEENTCLLEATPASLPFRLAQKTAPPRIQGVQSAIVTGPPGEEIYADADGCVRVHFHWDRHGPVDGDSSLPVRVVHPNLEGSMLLPRIGWEVWVAFENGDPDRPFILGRAYNGRHGPPVALPANKAMTMLSTSSSPGAGTTNAISYDDAAGKQGLNFHAGKGLTKSVGNDAKAQTVADEKIDIKGPKTLTIGGNQEEGIDAGPRVVSAPSLTVTVGANQTIKTPAAINIKVGSETVSCAVLMEQVGSPGGALGALGFQALMTVGGLIPLPGGWNTAKGIVLGAVGTAKSAYDAYKKDGVEGAATEVGKAALLGLLPGGDIIGDALDVYETSSHDETRGESKSSQGPEDNTVGGGPAAATGEAQDSGGGNRVFEIAGAVTEVVGGAYTVATGGQSKWSTLGASTIAVGGPHATSASKVSWLFGGASVHSTGVYNVAASGTLSRQVKVMDLNAASLTMTAKAGLDLRAKTISLMCGALQIDGKLVIEAGGTTVTVDGSGLTVKGATVDFVGPVVCDKSDRS